MYQYSMNFETTAVITAKVPDPEANSPWPVRTTLEPEPRQLQFEFSYRAEAPKRRAE